MDPFTERIDLLRQIRATFVPKRRLYAREGRAEPSQARVPSTLYTNTLNEATTARAKVVTVGHTVPDKLGMPNVCLEPLSYRLPPDNGLSDIFGQSLAFDRRPRRGALGPDATRRHPLCHIQGATSFSSTLVPSGTSSWQRTRMDLLAGTGRFSRVQATRLPVCSRSPFRDYIARKNRGRLRSSKAGIHTCHRSIPPRFSWGRHKV